MNSYIVKLQRRAYKSENNKNRDNNIKIALGQLKMQNIEIIPIYIEGEPTKFEVLSRKRISSFYQFLQTLYNAAPPLMKENLNIECDFTPNKLCKICEGKCCSDGGDTGYIDKHVLVNIIHDYSISSFSELKRYFDRVLPRNVYKSSCIFHSTTGCALHVTHRSYKCRKFKCIELKSLEYNEQSHHIAIIAKEKCILRSELILSKY